MTTTQFKRKLPKVVIAEWYPDSRIEVEATLFNSMIRRPH